MIKVPCKNKAFANAVLSIRTKYDMEPRRSWDDEYNLIVKKFLELHKAELYVEDYVFKYLIFNNETDYTAFLLRWS